MLANGLLKIQLNVRSLSLKYCLKISIEFVFSLCMYPIIFKLPNALKFKSNRYCFTV